MKYYQITNGDGKQWVMPAENMRVGMMLYQPSAWTGKMLKALLPWLAWCGIVRKKLHIQEVECPIPSSLDRRLQELFGENKLEYAVFNGTPCVHQKQTVQVYSGSRILGYCKRSSNPEIASLFLHERDYLQWLDERKVVCVPRCLACEQLPTGEWIFVQSTVKTMRSVAEHVLGLRQFGFLEQLHKKTSVSCSFYDSDLYRSLLRIDNCMDRFEIDEQEVIRQGYDVVKQYYISSEQHSFSAYHSDFTPWNMFVEGEQLFVFDWEYATRTSVPYLDLIHYLFQSCIFERHAGAEEVYRCLMDENKEMLNRYFDNLRVAVSAYLLDMIGMYAVRDAGSETEGSRQMQKVRIEVMRRVLTNYSNSR